MVAKNLKLGDFDKQKMSRDLPKTMAQEARVARIIDLGVREQTYQGQRKPPKSELLFFFELTKDKLTIKDEELPMMQLMKVTLSTSPKSKFANLLRALRIEDNETIVFENLLGKPVFLRLKKNGEYVNVDSVSEVSELVVNMLPPLVADSYFFDFDNPDPDVLMNKLSDNMKNKLKSALNYDGSNVQELLESKED